MTALLMRAAVTTIFVAAFDQGEPRRYLLCPAHEFTVTDLAAHLVGGAAGGLGLFVLSQVVVNSPEAGPSAIR